MGFEGDFVRLSKTYINEWKEKVYSKIYHPYLSNEIELAKIDDDKFYLLLSILQSKNISEREKENIAYSIMFIQIALDTHDLVKNDNEKIKSQKEQQLTVLAGDFYSGLYYRTLSLIPDINLIKSLAGAIKIVNENKIKVYTKEIKTFEEFMNSMQRIETVLYQTLAQYLKAQQFECISSDWLHLNQIIKEKEKYKRYLLNNETIFNREFQVEQINEMINQYTQNIKTRLVRYGNEQIDIEQFLHITSQYEERYDSSIV